MGQVLIIGLLGIPIRKWAWRSFWGSPLVAVGICCCLWSAIHGDITIGVVLAYGIGALPWVLIYWLMERKHLKQQADLTSRTTPEERTMP